MPLSDELWRAKVKDRINAKTSNWPRIKSSVKHLDKPDPVKLGVKNLVPFRLPSHQKRGSI